MNNSSVARLVGSGRHRAIADDALKDEDNAAWVLQLAPEVRDEWIARIGWVRLADRLAEEEFICNDGRRDSTPGSFSNFHRAWRTLRDEGRVVGDCVHPEILAAIAERWFVGRRDSLAIDAWDRYLDAIATYHSSHLALNNLQDYERMLERLAGAFFQMFPFLDPRQAEAARYFGMVDQFYNNLRDLHEDARQGICYFPAALLRRFGVDRWEILQGTCFDNPGYRTLMAFWLDDYLPRLRLRTSGLILAEDLHPSWQILRDWSLHRYARIERILRQCDFDFTAFSPLYWEAVRADLSDRAERPVAIAADKCAIALENRSAFVGLSPVARRLARRVLGPKPGEWAAGWATAAPMPSP